MPASSPEADGTSLETSHTELDAAEKQTMFPRRLITHMQCSPTLSRYREPGRGCWNRGPGLTQAGGIFSERFEADGPSWHTAGPGASPGRVSGPCGVQSRGIFPDATGLDPGGKMDGARASARHTAHRCVFQYPERHCL